jgi:pyruvate dehydrogenase E1 component
VPYIAQVMGGTQGPIIASSDYMKSIPDGLAPWLGGRLTSLGTDGFGRSENREHLRQFFEISAEAIVQATLAALAKNGMLDAHRAEAAIAELGFSQEKPDPAHL